MSSPPASGPPAGYPPTSGPPAGYPPTSGWPVGYPGQPQPGYPPPPASPGFPAAPGYPTGQQPPGYPTDQQPGYPPHGPGMEYPPGAYPQPGQPGPGQPFGAPPPKKRRGLLIAAISLVVVLLLCGGGAISAFLLLRDAEEGEGAPEPVAAAEAFLRAVYSDRDADKAASLVCSESRDQADIDRKVAEVEEYATTYQTPRFRWETPTIDEQNEERAIVSTKLIMTTGDEKVSEQQLRLTVVKKTGWWVCEVG